MANKSEKNMRKAANKAMIKDMLDRQKTIYKPAPEDPIKEDNEMIDSFQNDRSPIFDREMYNQPEPYGNPKKMSTGGMSSCPYRPDGVRGGGKAIAGMKFRGVK